MRGFSLVELSIVLVILGLLTGGILAGQSLIRAAELRAVTTEYQRYAAAVNTFRGKYFAIPGDMNNATRFWLFQSGANCTNSTGAATNAATGACDGDGDGILDGAGAGGNAGEIFQLWRHLALAGLIEGTYSGFAGASAANHHACGTNCPVSKLASAGWGLAYDAGGGSVSAYDVVYGNRFDFGGTTGALQVGKILKPEEAWNIDTKMDDGKPARGKVIARYWADECASADDGSSLQTDLNASYRLSDTTLQCALHFIQQF